MKFSYSRDQKKSLGMKISSNNKKKAYFTCNYLSITGKASISIINEVLSLLHINSIKISKDRSEDFNQGYH